MPKFAFNPGISALFALQVAEDLVELSWQITVGQFLCTDGILHQGVNPMIATCKKCRKMINSMQGKYLCPECQKEDDDVFRTVKEYIYKNPRATISEVSTTLDVSVNRIRRYLREGRLEIIEKHNLFLECEKCGVAIQTGRFCGPCANEFFKDLQKESETGEKKKGESLQYFHKNL